MKTIKTTLLTIAALLYCVTASAYDFEVDGIRYDITSFTDLTVKAASISETLTGELIIPSKILFNGKELTVTEIGDEFAVSNVAISSLTIDEGINSIGNRAFKNCSNLATVNIAQTVTQIGIECFYGCTSLNTFDNRGIVSLGSKSFAECGNLKEVSIENLASLTEGTFLNCTKLSDCNLPNISSIGKEAFKNCQSMAEYNITNDVESIGESAFEGCVNLSSIIIPDNVKELGKGIFKNCTALTSISIGTGTSYLPWIFEGCTNLSDIRIEDSYSTLKFGYTGKEEKSWEGTIGNKDVSIDYTSYPAMFTGFNLKNVYIGRNITTEKFCYYSMEYNSYVKHGYYIPNPPFSGSSIESLIIGSFVSDFKMFGSITGADYKHGAWNGAFQNCINLDSVTIYSTVTSIPENTFSGCRKLSSLEIPNSVIEIGFNAFYGCLGLKTLSLGSNLESIGSNALSGCDSLTEINLKSAIPPTYKTGFSSANYINTKVTVPTDVLSIYKTTEPWRNFWNISGNNDLISLFEVDGIKYSVINDKNVEIIGNSISELTELNIGSKIEYYGNSYNVVSISDAAFNNCSYLSSVRIENGVNSIGNSAFANCTNLKAINIPSNLQTIGNSAFYHCSLLDSIILPDSISIIPSTCFSGCKSLDSIIIPPSVTLIGYSAFSGCDSLISINMPRGVTTIDDYAFANCSKLKSFIIPSSVTYLGTCALDGCAGLKELVFEDCNTPLTLSSRGTFDTSTNLISVSGKNLRYMIEYYNSYFSNLPIEKLYIGRNLSNKSRYIISDKKYDASMKFHYYIITSYDAPFSNLSRLKELTIGENVDILGPEQEELSEVNLYVTPGSFKQCSSIQTVEVKNPTPPTGVEFTNNVYANASLIVPKGAENEYQEATGWKNFVNLIIETDSVVLDQQTITINVYDERQLHATVYPENATDTTIIWTSSDETVVKVSNSGRITAVSAGKATITAACGNVSASCEVEVVIVEPNEIILNKQAIMTTVNSVYQLHATVYPEDVTDKTVIWASSDESVAKVSESGYVVGISVGKAVITATCGNVSATCDVEVEVENFIKTQPTSENLLVELNTPEEGVKYQWYRLVEGMIYSKEIVPTSSGEYAWTVSNGIWTSGNNKEGPQTFSVMTATVKVQLGDTISFDYTVPKGDGRYDGGSQWFKITLKGETYMQTFGGKNGYARHYELDINDYIINYELNKDSTMTIGFECVRTNSERATVSNIKHTRPTGFCRGMVAEEIIGATTARLQDSLFVEGSVVYCVATLPNGRTLTSDKVNMYKVYYYVGEELVHVAEVPYGEAIPEYVYEPTVEGDEFLGWIGETYETMPAHDVTYTANIESGINLLLLDNGQLTIYDLMGRKVTDIENLKGGVYIINGRKFVVK